MIDFGSPASLLLVAGVCLGCSFFLTRVLLGYARSTGLVDHPGPRRSHANVTPRGGGVAIILTVGAVGTALLKVAGTELVWVLAGLAAITAVGFWEDHKTLPRWLRFVLQMLICAVVSWALTSGDPLWWRLGVIIALVWMINLFNFMDGINGLAGAETIFAGCVIAFAALQAGNVGAVVLAASLAAATLGFLPWNFPVARIFLGDGGSYGLGYLLGALILWGHHAGFLSVWAGAGILGVFVIDATLTLLMRMATGARWYTPHREHAYQLLVKRGWKHTSVVAWVTLINVGFILPVLIWLEHPGLALAVIFPVLGLLWWVVRMKFSDNQANR